MFDWAGHGWINYKQEQPEKIGRYLCVIECKHFDNTTEFGLDILIWLPRPFDGWFSEDANEGVACLREYGLRGQLEVKYWTLIPELPEEEAEGEQHD